MQKAGMSPDPCCQGPNNTPIPTLVSAPTIGLRRNMIICMTVFCLNLSYCNHAFAKSGFEVLAYLDQDRRAVSHLFDSVRARAERGNLNAQHELGALLATGRGNPQNYFEAAQWFIRAAVRGHDNAQYWLGNLYMRGAGLPRDFNRMAMWWRKSAEQGNISAQYALAAAYRDGRAIGRDRALSHAWFAKAANKTGTAGLRRSRNVARIRVKTRRMTAAEVAREEATARRFARDFKGEGQRGR